jgi:hypothetical protein
VFATLGIGAAGGAVAAATFGAMAVGAGAGASAYLAVAYAGGFSAVAGDAVTNTGNVLYFHDAANEPDRADLSIDSA